MRQQRALMLGGVAALTLGVASFAWLPASGQPAAEPAKAANGKAARKLPDVLLQPADSVRLAAADAISLDPEYAVGVRYISLYNIHPDERDNWRALIDFTLCSLSPRTVLVYTTPLPGSEGSLLRLDLVEFEIDPKAWDDLGAKGSGPIRSAKKIDQPDPYFHTLVQVAKKTGSSKPAEAKKDAAPTQPAGKDGKAAEPKKEAKDDPFANRELQHAPWIAGEDIVALAKTTKTDFPVLRGDWFVRNALLAPAYNDFLRVKKLADVQELGRFRKRDEDIAVRGVVTFSDEVALHQRAIRFVTTSLGLWSETYDYLTSVDNDDLLSDLLLERRDASEIIFTLPNKLQGYALTNATGLDQVIDFADPNVAADTRTAWRNKLVWTAVSCITCHDQGIKPVTDEVRLLSNERTVLLIKDRKDFKRVVDLYSRPIQEPVAVGQAIYAAAVQQVTRGWTPKKLAAFLAEKFLAYEEASIDLDTAAMEWGYKPDTIKDLLGRLRGADHSLGQLFEKRPVRRDHWEAKGFGQGLLALQKDAAANAGKAEAKADAKEGSGK